MNDFFRLLGAALGGAVTVAAIGAEEYGRLLKRAFLPSLILIAAAVALVILSELAGNAFFNMLAVLVIGFVLIGWMVLALPVFGAVELARSIAWEPVRRLIRLFSSTLCVILVFAIIAVRLPAGFDGVTWAGILLTLFVGLSFFGAKVSRTFLALQLIGAGLFAAIGLLIPTQIAVGLTDRIEAETTRAGRELSGRPGELDISLAVLTGSAQDAPLLYDPKGREPRWWCRAAEETASGIRCYDRPGRDPYSSDVLIPISPDIVDGAISRLRLKESNDRAAEAERLAAVERERAAEEEARRVAEAERLREIEENQIALAAAQQAAEEEALQVYRAANLNLNGTRSSVTLNIKAGDRFERSFEKEVREGAGLSAPGAFRDAALSNGVYERILNGDATEIGKLDLPQIAEHVVAGDLRRVFTPNTAIPGSGTMKYRLQLTGIETATGSVAFTETVDAEAAGQSERIAEGRARAALVERAGQILKAQLAGR